MSTSEAVVTDPRALSGSIASLTGWQLTAMVIVVCTGFSSQMVEPIWIGQVIDTFHLSTARAGSIASLEFMTVAAVSLAIATLIGRIPSRLLCVIGTALLFAGNLMSMMAPDTDTLTIARVICGAGKGLVVAIIFGLAGQTSNPTRTFGVLNAAYAAFSAVIFLIVPRVVGYFGMRGAFGSMVALSVLGAAFLLWVPESRPEAQSPRPDSAGASRSQSTSRLGSKLRDWLRSLPATPTGLLAALALAILWAAHGSIWVFIERIGIRDGLDLNRIGLVLSVGSALTIAGPLLSHVLEIKRGARLPIVAGLVILSAMAASLCLGRSPLGYTLAAPLFSLTALFLMPYIQGLLGFADPSGKLNAGSSAFMTLGGAFAPFVGGSLIDSGGYTALAASVLALFAVVLALLWPIASRHDSHVHHDIP